MEEGTKDITRKSILLFIVVLLFGLLIIFRISQIQFFYKEKYQKFVNENNLKKIEYTSRRGNIYSEEGYLLATSTSKYDIRIDLMSIKDKLFNDSISFLCDSLTLINPKLTKKEWQKKLVDLKYNKKSRYVLISKQVSYSDYERFKKFPILNRGKYKGGFIYEESLNRALPMKEVAKRFIGYEDYRGKAGLEGAYSTILKGRPGEKIIQKIIGGEWKTINELSKPEDGSDIVTTINFNFQNKAHTLLKTQLEKYSADHGCIVVMEVETGEIKAISNLKRGENGNFYEERNYALYESTEPGSTFKLISVLAMLEDNLVTKDTKVDINNGKYSIYGMNIKDEHQENIGEITLKEAFEKSSNVGITKLVYENYKKKPSNFIDRLYKMGLGKQLKLDIKGEGDIKIPTPKDPRWSGISLAWISYGYEVSLAPIHILTFYNAVANNGKMVKPFFIKKIINKDNTINETKVEVIKESIASENNIKTVQELLRNVVTKGTASSINDDPKYEFAGKTGTAQRGYWKDKNNISYMSSFVGYFPYNNPKYSCIVVIHEPKKEIGYYGNKVAAPVFRDLARYIYKFITPDEKIEFDKTLAIKDLEKKLNIDNYNIKTEENIMPNLLNVPLYKAISICENLGLRVKIEGYGKVKEQTIKYGERIRKNEIIGLKSY